MDQIEAYWANAAAEVEQQLLARVGEVNVRPRLEPTRMLTELLGDPQKSYRVIHVTGTNGKTSTTRMIERILRELGLRTGRFTSPHLVHFNERITIDGEPVSDQVLVEVWNDIKPIVELVDDKLVSQGEGKLTFFEVLAALAFSCFADAPIDVLVLEVGMGGEWDSTNVADGDVAVFTPIGIDHADRLGNTIAEIAATKAGIIKPESIVVSASQVTEARDVLLARAESTADAWAESGVNFEILASATEDLGQRFSVRTLAATYTDLFIPLKGAYQVENAALAIAAVEAFIGGGTKAINDAFLRSALADATSPGRLQVISRSPLVILDAAHNPHGASSLANALVTDFGAPYTIAVLATLADKDAQGIFEALDDVVSGVVITQSSSARAVPADELASIANRVFGAERVTVESDAITALDRAIEMLPTDFPAAVVVSGSISLVGEILAAQQADVDMQVELDDDWQPEFEVKEIYEEEEDGSQDT